MSSYVIKCVSEPVDWDNIASAPLSECAWSPNPAPKASVQAVFIPDKGLVFHLKSLAAPTRTENWEPDSRVWEDSCLEVFLAFTENEYINLEANSNSALRASVGPDRTDRKFISLMDIEQPQLSALEGPDSWEIFLFVPSDMVRSLYNIDLKPGVHFKGNFYSCGDLTPAPHYSAWNSVDTAAPDFHRPEFFGDLEISGQV